MNPDNHSPECLHGAHGACDYDECACECHQEEPWTRADEDACFAEAEYWDEEAS